jgi:hypothetical protein
MLFAGQGQSLTLQSLLLQPLQEQLQQQQQQAGTTQQLRPQLRPSNLSQVLKLALLPLVLTALLVLLPAMGY